VSDEPQPGTELARQVVVTFAAGLAGYLGPGAGAIAAGAAPLVLAGIDYISATIGTRRLEHATETLTDAADEFGAKTLDEFMVFIQAAASDAEHQELLARALTIAQDTAMRDKRRALGRALAAAAGDTGTKVDVELLFVCVLADLDAPHIRVLRITSTVPPHLDAIGRQMEAIGRDPVRQWYPWSIAEADPGLADTAWALLDTLKRHGLLWSSGDQLTEFGHQPEYTITSYGEHFLDRLAQPD
jgi:hypothetical protein